MANRNANAVLFSTLAFFAAQNAWADCTPAGTAGADVITCDNAPNDVDGIDAGADNDSVTVNGDAIVSNSGADAIGTGGGIDIVTNNGSVQTSGNDADAIQDPDGGDTLTNAATGTILTTGINSAGIRVSGDSALVENLLGGLISTSGQNAHAIAVTGNSNVVDNYGTLSTSGADANGVSVLGDSNSVNNFGTITGSGSGGEGFDASGNYNNLDNNGTITTSGDFAEGMEITGNSNHADNYDTITTTGYGADGIRASGDYNDLHNLGGGTITTSGDAAIGISANGDGNQLHNYSGSTITTGGTESHGLYAYGSGGTGNTVINSGTVSTSGDGAAGIGVGGSALTGNTATNDGSITTTGTNAVGILGATGDNNLLNNGVTGTVTTSGLNADGMRLIGDDTIDGVEDAITNSGTLATTGADADGISLSGNDSEVVNAGTITTSGGVGGVDTLAGADGIEIDGNGNLVSNSGPITTSGTDAEGIRMSGDSNSVTNTGSGSISTSGAYAEGILVEGTGNSVTSGGTVTTSGSGSDGIATAGSGNGVTNTGTVSVGGTFGLGSDAVSLGGTGDTLSNSGTITNTYIYGGSGVAVRGGDGGVSVTNVGTISSSTDTAILTGSGADTITSSGSSAISAGSFAINTGEGDDTVTLSDDTQVTGDVDGGSGASDDLVLDGTGTHGDITGNVYGFESLTKNEFGLWHIFGDAAVGTASLNAGTLGIFGGALDAGAGGTAIASGAELQLFSSSSIAGNVTNNGTLDTTGNDIPVTIASDYTQGATGTLEMITGVSSARTDVQVSGMVSLDGTVDVSFQDEAFVPFGNSTYNIVSGTSRTGTFATENVSGITDPTITIVDDGIGGALVSYDAISAFLSLNRSTDFLGTLSGLNEVQIAAGQFIDLVTGDGAITMDFSDVLLDVVALSDDGQKQFLQTASTGTHDDVAQAGRRLTQGFGDLIGQRQDLTRLTGDLGTAQQASLAGLKLASNHTRGLVARESQGPAGWLGAFGGKSDLDEDDGRLGFDADWYGAAAGFDLRFGSAGMVGLAAGAARMDLDLASGGGDAEVDATFGALYGGWYPGPHYVEGRVSYTALDYEEDRNIVVGPSTLTANSDHDGDEIAATFETGLTSATGANWQLNPFLALNYGRLDEDGYRESGAGPLNHIVQDRLTEYLTSELGAQYDHLAPSGGGELYTFVRLGWVYDFDIDDRNLVAGFEGTPGRSFSLDGRDLSNHGARLGAGMTWLARNDWSVGMNFGGEWRGDETAYAAMVQVSKTLK